MNDPQFYPGQDEGSPKSLKSSGSAEPDGQFIHDTATQFGGVIHMALGLWKRVWHLSHRGIECSPAHELLNQKRMPKDEQVIIESLFEPAMEAQLCALANSVGPLYKEGVGGWVETAQYIGCFNGCDVAISCNHGPWTYGDHVWIDFGGVLALAHGPSGRSHPAVVIHVEAQLDMIIMAIPNRVAPGSLSPLDLALVTDLQVGEAIYVIGYHCNPTEETWQKFQESQLNEFKERISATQARDCLLPNVRMVSVGKVTEIQSLQNQFFVSATLYHGASGSPVFALREGNLKNIGFVHSGSAGNQNICRLYSPATQSIIQMAVANVSPTQPS